MSRKVFSMGAGPDGDSRRLRLRLEPHSSTPPPMVVRTLTVVGASVHPRPGSRLYGWEIHVGRKEQE